MEKAKILAIDTNVIVTYRLKRGKEFKQILQLFRDCLQGKIYLYIPLPAILEAEWVLRSFYKQSKEQIISFLEELFLIDNVTTDDKTEVQLALNLYEHSSQVSFTDCVIIYVIKNRRYDFLTFDKDLQKLYYSI